MKDYTSIRAICKKNSSFSGPVIDEFLIYYAASLNKLEHKMTKEFSFYKHVTKKLNTEWVNRLKAQYLGHKIFKTEGLIKKLLSHVELKRFGKAEMDFLKQQAAQPWKFSFSVITDKPAKDFFIMRDVFSAEEYTLFSPGITDINENQSATLWFNLLGYNGVCWQSFGPIGAYRSFEADDIYFLATELNPEIEDDKGVMEDVEKNPLPYMMLLSGANYPLTFNKKDQIVQVLSEYDLDSINTQELKKNFKTEYSDNVYRFTLKDWGEHPHFAHAYFDEIEQIIVFTASTDRGFHALVNKINQYGYSFSEEPFIRVNPSMIITAGDILKKEIVLNEYDQMFHVEPSKESQGEIDKLNVFMGLILPDINAGRKPDIGSLAKKAGVDINVARDLVKQLTGKFGNLG